MTHAKSLGAPIQIAGVAAILDGGVALVHHVSDHKELPGVLDLLVDRERPVIGLEYLVDRGTPEDHL